MTIDTPAVSAALARIREMALLLPEAEERPGDGQPTFCVDGTPFAEVRENQDDDGLHVVIVRTSGMDEQAMLIETAPEVYSTPADLGASGWVGMTLTGDVDWPLVEDRIARSWELTAPRRLLEAGGR